VGVNSTVNFEAGRRHARNENCGTVGET
jgi:hypothetical protein